MEQKNKLDRFLTAVNTVTDQQVNDILAEAEQEKNSILSAAKESAEEAKKRYLSDNLKMSSGKCVRMVSKAELDMKKEVLVCREQLTDELFGKVCKRLEEYRKSPEYEKRICAAIAEEEGLDSARISISPDDMALAEKIKKASGGKAEVTADESIKYGGFTVLRTDRGTITDRTFDCAMKEQLSLFSSRNLMAAQEGNVK